MGIVLYVAEVIEHIKRSPLNSWKGILMKDPSYRNIGNIKEMYMINSFSEGAMKKVT